MREDSAVHSEHISIRLRWRRRAMVALLFALVALVATGGWIVYFGVHTALQAERTLHATLFAVRLVERFVSERGRWPRSWGELEGVSMDDDRYCERWPATRRSFSGGYRSISRLIPWAWLDKTR